MIRDATADSYSIPESQYLRLPLCLDSAGHRFKLDLTSRSMSVCERCGLIRKKVEW